MNWFLRFVIIIIIIIFIFIFLQVFIFFFSFSISKKQNTYELFFCKKMYVFLFSIQTVDVFHGVSWKSNYTFLMMSD